MGKTNKGTNLDKLRQKFDESKSRGEGGGSGVDWWKPNWGDNLIRVLPPINEDDVFYHETARHRLNGEWYYCLKYHKDSETGRGSVCPICEARTRMYRSGDESLIRIAKDLKARKQYMMNIVDRNDEDEKKVNVYSTGVKLWNKMVTTMLDDDIDITDVEDGYDFLVKKEEGAKTEYGQFPSYDNSKAKRKSSPLHEDADTVKTILGNRIDLAGIPRFDEEAVLKGAVDSYIKSLTDPQDDSEFYGENQDKQEAKPPKRESAPKSDISSFKDKLKAQLSADDDDDDDDE